METTKVHREMKIMKKNQAPLLKAWENVKGELREWWKSRNRMEDDSEHETIEDRLV